MNDPNKLVAALEQEIEKLKFDNRALFKIVSHDIRSPLNKVFALVNLLKMADGTLTKEQEGYLQNIEAVLSDGLQNMRNLLELRSLESDEMPVRQELVDLRDLLTRIGRNYEPACRRKNINLELKANQASTFTDKLAISKIMDQLLSNAIKFSPKDSKIELSLSTEADHFLIKVVDGGYGISEDEQKKLFGKFVVLSTPATAGESKTGIGLYIAWGIANKLGMTLSYRNDGSGSTFTLKIPPKSLA